MDIVSNGSTNILAGLNEQQVFAVTHYSGPMLILAGAGSGKTRAITHRIAYLIECGLATADQILGVTFTNKAAEEMRARVVGMLDAGSGSRPPLLCTFHSFCVRILRRDAPRIGFRNDFTIYDTEDQKSLLREILKERKIDEQSLPIRKAASRISAAKNRSVGPKQYLAQANHSEDELIGQVYQAYEQALVRNSAMDFDDLLLQSVKLLRDFREPLENYGTRFRYLVVDEYQDTNRPQYELIRLLTTFHNNICVVGDEDQSIYGFRGADINNILSFEKDFPGAVLVRLEQNYRSTQRILDAAGAVVANNVQRKGKVLWTDNRQGERVLLYEASTAQDEGEYVAAKVRELLAPGKRVAVLYRTNFQSRVFEETFRRHGTSYNIVGSVSFYGRAEVKDVFAYLRVAVNPDDSVSLLRILNKPSRGLGKATLDIVTDLSRRNRTSVWESIRHLLENRLVNARVALALEKFVQLVTSLGRDVAAYSLPDLLAVILDRSGYETMLKDEGTEDAENRLMNLQEVINAAREHAERGESLQEFLDSVALISDADSYDSNAQVVLTTLHNAKGLEFHYVFLVGLEEGLFPHTRSFGAEDLEEERRLCYVGMTRAMERLYMTCARSRRFFGSELPGYVEPSRFLNEIPQALMERECRFGQFGRESLQGGVVGSGMAATKKRNYQGQTYNTVEGVQEFLRKKGLEAPAPGSGSADPAGGATSLKKGMQVFHEKYGYGVIQGLEKTGADVKLTVRFSAFGEKKLIERFANLKPV